MILNSYFKCPCCQGSQYRTSSFDVSAQNPYGAKCIFCKSVMVMTASATLLCRPPITKMSRPNSAVLG
ncbi:hypothetical protein [Dickeya lacustris]|uniref:Cold-shock protein n=1 Tax=Dickeya lacustris TaxID=2259638 RepID=A0ABY8GBZ0_9GAMM|nr:hypothetical protein [Dickeya lacustris]WFN57541.1 hypothetical protein O1Q98_05050 [Dickeya lacustris]